MTYLDYINAFERWCEHNPLLASSMLLYYKLLVCSNRCGWPEWVQVDNDRLMASLRTKDNKKLDRARDQLTACGIIAYQKGKKGYPGRYRLLDFYDQTPTYMPMKTPTYSPTYMPIETPNIDRLRLRDRSSSGADAYAREDLAVCCQHYERNIGTLSQSVGESILYRLESGAQTDLVCAAMDEACKCNKRSWKYVDAILKRCAEQNVFTADAFRLQSTGRNPARASAPKANPFDDPNL